MLTVVHVTHEAIQKIGGIGAVLHGLLTSRHYLAKATRNILVGPYWHTGRLGDDRLGEGGEVLYSSMDGIDRTAYADGFRAIEARFGVRIVYGRRTFADATGGVTSTPEVLLIDVSQFDAARIADFKFRVWERFAIDSGRHEGTWDYEQWMRLAQPAIDALKSLGAADADAPCVLLSHEYMGMPTVMAALLDPAAAGFRSIFYAHEVATIRRIVEEHPGHDTMFYNAMRIAQRDGRHVEDVFGPQDDFYKHALIRHVNACDGLFGVGDYVLKEFGFLGPQFAGGNASLAYNGVPHFPIDAAAKRASRQKLRRYCDALLGFEPTFVFTHVTRLVPSKGLWRDLTVLARLERQLGERGESAVLFVLSTETLGRSPEDVLRMERDYAWPVSHREGAPDLSGGEAGYYALVQAFNARARHAKVVYINQFGFSRAACGATMAPDMEFMDIRKGSDVEFGQSIYEPFGIAQVEPISFGGICVYTEVCGCAGFVRKAARDAGLAAPSNAIEADYTRLPRASMSEADVLGIGRAEREAVEALEASRVADLLIARLPRTVVAFDRLIDQGQQLARHMSWDAVAAAYVVPGIERAARGPRPSAH